ncbi:MAG: preprotein translocase subunit SecY [archaeon]|nr:MAG: preprotein translocase subunit SecY [archaeon]
MAFNYLALMKFLPGVQKPEKRLNFRQKLKWTGLILILFFVMSQVILWGVDLDAVQHFLFLETVLGSSMGSLVTLGIGPIVTASIILQLLTGSGILKWDMSSHEGKMKFMGTQKILALFFCFFEAIAFVMFGAIPAAGGLSVMILVILQLAAGGILIILMDEVVSKWGIGSGVSLFIAGGVSKTIIIRTLSFVGEGGPAGALPSAIMSFMAGRPEGAFISLIPLAFTIVVFLFVGYAQLMKVEIPLTMGSIRGFGYRHPLKFIYASNIPVILTSALLANFEIFSRMLADRGLSMFGSFNAEGQVTGGLMFFISPPRENTLSNLIVSIISGVSISPAAFTWITYTIFMVVGAIIFSVFWVNTAGMDSRTVAKQLHDMGLGIPGFRRDIRIIEKILDRYILALSVMGGAFVGLLASFADFTGAFGSGTGILLTVMIIFNLYEQITQQHMEDMNPAVRKFLGS